MQLTIESDPAEFAAQVVPFLVARRVEHAKLLTLLHSAIASKSRAFCIRVSDDHGSLVGIGFAKSAGGDLNLSDMPNEAIRFVADQLAANGNAFSGIAGLAAIAEEFAQHWASFGQQHIIPGMRRRIYELGDLILPNNVPGGLVIFNEGHRGQLIEWWQAYLQETYDSSSSNPSGEIDQRLSEGGIFLWELDEKPVAFGTYVGPASGIVQVGPIYTPPQFRRHGFAAALTAEISQIGRDLPVECVMLRADVANATSNRVYQRIGYQPRSEMQDYFCQ